MVFHKPMQRLEKKKSSIELGLLEVGCQEQDDVVVAMMS